MTEVKLNSEKSSKAKTPVPESNDKQSLSEFKAGSGAPGFDNSYDDRRFILKVIRYVLQLLLLLAAVYLCVKIFPFLLPIFFGLIIARSAAFFSLQIDRVFNLILPRRKEQPSSRLIKRRHTRSIVLYFVLVILFFLLVAWAIHASVESVKLLAQQLPRALRNNNFGEMLQRSLLSLDKSLSNIGLDNLNVDRIMLQLSKFQDVLIEKLPQLLTTFVNATSKAVGSLPLASLMILITIMSGYYFLRDSAKFYLIGRRLIPSKTFVRRLFNLLNAIVYTLFRIVGGYILIFFVVFLQAWLGLSIVRFPNASLWAIFIAFVDMLPVLGISATMIPMSIYLFITASSWQGALTLLIMILMWTSRRFFEPLILGGAMRLHPLLTIFAMILGIKIYGLGGVLVGPVILVIMREIMQVFQLRNILRQSLGRLVSDRNADSMIPATERLQAKRRSTVPKSIRNGLKNLNKKRPKN
ncbi:MAG: AI-2E family transporter [Eubacteriales bacterium]|nr:AI-2E family transporter [Eubacteriales bacterium]